MEFDLFTLLPLAAAIFVFWKLRSVLGTRNGNERPPYNPYADRTDKSAAEADPSDNVVTLPGADRRRASDADQELQAAIERVAGKNAALKLGLTAIAARDPSFEPEEFLGGAKMAYEMIVTGFADGDKRTLKGLLSREVYDNFVAVIDDRASRKERIEASFVGVERVDISSAELLGDDAHVTVKFVSQMISATLDKEDNVIEGDQQEVAEIIDVWTFARSVKSRDPNWKLVATDQ